MKGLMGKYGVGSRVLKIGLLLVFPLVNSLGVFATPAVPVRLTWDASPDSAVAGYAVYYGKVNSMVTNRLDVGSMQSAVISTLQTKSNYFFYVAAYTANGVESDPSNIIQYAPPAITSLKMAQTGDGSVTLQFRGPAGAQCAIEYTESLDSPQWKTLASAIADTEGNIAISDTPNTQAAMRFYRAVAP